MNNSNQLCPHCNMPFAEIDTNCKGCSYPFQGSQQEKDFFRSERTVKELELSDLSSKVDSARKSLFIIAGIDSVYALIIYFSTANDTDRIPNLIGEAVVIAIFIALGMWAKKKTKSALITGLVVFLSLHLLNALFNPLSIVSGIVFKIIIVAYLIKGIKAASQSDQLKKELNIT